MIANEQTPNIDRTSLEPLAQAASDCLNLQIATWQVTRLSQQGRRSIFRLSGTGTTNAGPRNWSLILKEIRAPEDADAHDTDVHDWSYWPREPLLYAAGIPQTLSGDLRAPHCYGVVQPQPAVQWIWLEDVQDAYDRVWPIERYALAARHLGAFNGAYLAGKPLPTAPYLVTTGLLTRSTSAVADFERLRDPGLWSDPRVQRAFPRPILDQLERLIADRERFLGVMERLPQTFCHFDAWHGNMAAVKDANGADTTVLFDWALACFGAVGQEIANMVWTALLEFKVDQADIVQLETSVFENYLEGLQAAGWQPDPQAIRCAYLITSVLMFGLTPEAQDHALNEDEHPALECAYGWPIERMIRQSADATYLLLERADQLRHLLGAL